MRHILLFTVVSATLIFAQINAEVNFYPAPQGRLLTAEQGCGYSKVLHPRIVGGAPTRPGAYPWMALLGAVDKGTVNFVCGGSVITSRHILTAAHCISPTLAFVRLGEHDILTTVDGPHQDFKISRVTVHPQYSDLQTGDGTSDVAIITLEKDVDFTDRVRPICLPIHPSTQQLTLVNQNPFVAGWGITQYGIPQTSKILKAIQVSVLANAQCEAAYRVHFLFTGYNVKRTQFSKAVICAGQPTGGGPGTGFGDSGGPLMLPFFDNGMFPMYQIGIVSWGPGVPHAFSPGVYARVTHFMDWIQKTISQK